MKTTIKNFNKIAKKSILFYTIIYLICIIFLIHVAHLFDLRCREWIHITSLIIGIIGTLMGIIQLVLKIGNKIIKNILMCIIIFIIVAISFCSPIIMFILSGILVPEHVVEKDGNKMVAYVYGFLETEVEYYDYVNWFFCGNKLKIHEDYGDGDFDPILHPDKWNVKRSYYYDDNDNVIDNKNFENKNEKNDSELNIDQTIENSKINDNSENKVFDFENNVKIMVSIVDHAMGKEAITINYSNDGGKTWTSRLQTENKYMEVYYNSSFLFINENTGFIFDPGRDGQLDSKSILYVTTDGGRTFKESNINPINISNNDLHLEGLPNYENGKLNLVLYSIENNEYSTKNYYLYSTKNNGISWDYEKKFKK